MCGWVSNGYENCLPWKPISRNFARHAPTNHDEEVFLLRVEAARGTATRDLWLCQGKLLSILAFFTRKMAYPLPLPITHHIE